VGRSQGTRRVVERRSVVGRLEQQLFDVVLGERDEMDEAALE
jgi:hypothetical protein